MPAHPECPGFNQNRFTIKRELACLPDSLSNLKIVIAFNEHSFKTIPRSAFDQVLAGELFFYRSGESVAVIFNHKNERKFPYARKVQCFVKISLTCGTITTKADGDLSVIA